MLPARAGSCLRVLRDADPSDWMLTCACAAGAPQPNSGSAVPPVGAAVTEITNSRSLRFPTCGGSCPDVMYRAHPGGRTCPLAGKLRRTLPRDLRDRPGPNAGLPDDRERYRPPEKVPTRRSLRSPATPGLRGLSPVPGSVRQGSAPSHGRSAASTRPTCSGVLRRSTHRAALPGLRPPACLPIRRSGTAAPPWNGA